MNVIDGNEATLGQDEDSGAGTTPAAAAPQMDPNTVADLVMGRLFQMTGGAPSTPAQQRRATDDIVAELKAANFQEDYIEGVELATRKMEQRFEQMLQERESQYLNTQKHTRATEEINRVLDEYASADEAVEYAKDALFAKVVERFNADPTVLAKFQRGQVDSLAVKRLVKEEVSKFAKKVGREVSKTPAMKPSGLKPAAQAPAQAPANLSEMSDDAQSLYENQVSLWTRSGYSKEEAHNKALAAASRLPK